jgi:hypothetical protein
VRFLKWLGADFTSGENIDLWILFLLAAAFTVLGVTGVASVDKVLSLILALLAVLAISQLRGRFVLNATLESQRATALGVLQTDFPESLYKTRENTHSSYLFVGVTMGRTLRTSQPMIERLLQRNGLVRVVLPDPSNSELMRMASSSRRVDEGGDAIAAKIRQTLAELEILQSKLGGAIEVRLTTILPRVCINAFDVEERTGLIVVQHYEYRPNNEAAPILEFRPSDTPWYDRFKQESQRIFDDALSA